MSTIVHAARGAYGPNICDRTNGGHVRYVNNPDDEACLSFDALGRQCLTRHKKVTCPKCLKILGLKKGYK